MLGKRKRGDIGKYKFCPVCGDQLQLEDGYCTRCGYAFSNRRRKRSRKLKLVNIMVGLIIVAAFYFGVRLLNGKTIIPTSIPDIFNLI